MELKEILAQEDNKNFKTDPIFACMGKLLLDFLGLPRAFTEMIGGESHHTRNHRPHSRTSYFLAKCSALLREPM